ncbi:unnamed protein product [Lampetra fluviatilis]
MHLLESPLLLPPPPLLLSDAFDIFHAASRERERVVQAPTGSCGTTCEICWRGRGGGDIGVAAAAAGWDSQIWHGVQATAARMRAETPAGETSAARRRPPTALREPSTRAASAVYSPPPIAPRAPPSVPRPPPPPTRNLHPCQNPCLNPLLRTRASIRGPIGSSTRGYIRASTHGSIRDFTRASTRSSPRVPPPSAPPSALPPVAPPAAPSSVSTCASGPGAHLSLGAALVANCRVAAITRRANAVHHLTQFTTLLREARCECG